MKPIVQKQNLRLLLETGIQRAMNVLFTHPDKEFSLTDIAKEAGVAKSLIGTILNELQKLKLIQITKLTKIWRIRADRESSSYLRSKIVHNLNFVYQSGLVDFLNDHFSNPRAIVLFGSFRKGEDISTSDIDIAVESDEHDEYETIGLRELVDFERTIGRRIQIHFFNRKNVDRNLFNNIANGIVLMGFLEVNP